MMNSIPPIPPVPVLSSGEMSQTLNTMVKNRKPGAGLATRIQEQKLRRAIAERRREERGWPSRSK